MRYELSSCYDGVWLLGWCLIAANAAPRRCVERKEKLKVIKEQVDKLDQRKQYIVYRTIIAERRGETWWTERKPLADFLQVEGCGKVEYRVMSG